ncbi:branched-chain amino acid ABC transporter permease [Streptosporangium sp. NPDC004631]
MLFLQQITDGIATGAIYASIGLALVLIFRSTGIANFAQGEMAMFSTFVAWQLIAWGLPVPVAALVAVVFAFVVGAATERFVVRPAEGGSHLNTVILTFGLYLVFNEFAALIWHSTPLSFPTLAPERVWSVGGWRMTSSMVVMVGALAVESLAVYLLLRRTTLGLWMRASAANPESSALVGIDVKRMLMLGWGLAGVFGAIAGILIAPRVFLEPNMMSGILLYAFAAVILGGLDSVLGAVVGGVLIGVIENLVGTYVTVIGPDLKVVVPLVVIVLVLMLRPAGLFGAVERVRV